MDFVVDKKGLYETSTIPSCPLILREGDILIQILKFSFTANNISYAATGDALKYWEFFPLDNDNNNKEGGGDEMGRIPVWGVGVIVASRRRRQHNIDIDIVGRRVYGYFPMSHYVVMHPVEVTNSDFIDGKFHRRELPAVYNQYLFTDEDPFYSPRTEESMMILRPLFFTSWLLLDFFTHPTTSSYDIHSSSSNKPFFGSDTIIISSASSKTSIGLAFLLYRYNNNNNNENNQQKQKSNNNKTIRIVGLTSSRNVEMVKSLQIYDDVIEYNNDLETRIDTTRPTCFVDMAGNTQLTTKLHKCLQENMRYSCLVGASHVGKGGKPTKPLAGARPKFFFAPSWTAQRIKELGGGGSSTAVNRRRGLKILLHQVLLDYQLFVNWCLGTINHNLEEGKGKQWLHMKRYLGSKEVTKGYTDCLQGKINPDTAVIMSLWPSENEEEILLLDSPLKSRL